MEEKGEGASAVLAVSKYVCILTRPGERSARLGSLVCRLAEHSPSLPTNYILSNLMWISHAELPLSADELYRAVAVELGSRHSAPRLKNDYAGFSSQKTLACVTPFGIRNLQINYRIVETWHSGALFRSTAGLNASNADNIPSTSTLMSY